MSATPDEFTKLIRNSEIQFPKKIEKIHFDHGCSEEFIIEVLKVCPIVEEIRFYSFCSEMFPDSQIEKGIRDGKIALPKLLKVHLEFGRSMSGMIDAILVFGLVPTVKFLRISSDGKEPDWIYDINKLKKSPILPFHTVVFDGLKCNERNQFFSILFTKLPNMIEFSCDKFLENVENFDLFKELKSLRRINIIKFQSTQESEKLFKVLRIYSNLVRILNKRLRPLFMN